MQVAQGQGLVRDCALVQAALYSYDIHLKVIYSVTPAHTELPAEAASNVHHGPAR